MAIRVNPTVVAVAPVSTALFDPLTVGAQGALSIQVENLDATETFNGTVRGAVPVQGAVAVSNTFLLDGTFTGRFAAAGAGGLASGSISITFIAE